MLIDHLLTIFKNFQSYCFNHLNSKPVRVVRNYKGRKSSESAPEEGNRYDGIYKVVKYWPEKNKNGFIVWKYLFRRDDEVGTLQGKTVRGVFADLIFVKYQPFCSMHASIKFVDLKMYCNKEPLF